HVELTLVASRVKSLSARWLGRDRRRDLEQWKL
ncbi:hypothetical protein A2U01_0097316, partial [Trifolium medium]|nr:hypothetical protein [Trifolium medium]